MKEDSKEGKLFEIVFLLMLPFIAIIYLILYLTGYKFEYEPLTERPIVSGNITIGDKQFPFLIVLDKNKQLSEEHTNMITVKGTTPDTPFSILIESAADAEGSPIPVSNFQVSQPESDNDSAVQITNWDAETRSGVMHFGTSNPDGTPNIGNVTANVLNQDGSVAAPIGVQIAVTHGDVASFEGGFEIYFAEEGNGDTEPTEPTEGNGDTEPVEGNGDSEPVEPLQPVE